MPTVIGFSTMPSIVIVQGRIFSCWASSAIDLSEVYS